MAVSLQSLYEEGSFLLVNCSPLHRATKKAQGISVAILSRERRTYGVAEGDCFGEAS